MSDKKIEQFWRDATAADVARVMAGENVYARFRDRYADGWAEYYLSGVNGKNWIAGNFRWDLCQVYDPPEWYTNKPDPGEGYRLLEKFPLEAKLGTDDYWSILVNEWRSVGSGDNEQHKCVWYRRRIEPVKVESRSKDYIPNGWIKLPDDEPRLESDAYWSQGASEWCLIGKDRVEYANRDKWPAIRQVNSYVSLMSAPSAFEWVTRIDDRVRLPNGKRFRVTKEGFEVL